MINKIQADLKAAMFAKDSEKTMVLRSALSAYQNEAVAKGLGPQGMLTEADSLVVLKRLVKSREDSVEAFTKGGALDRADAEKREIVILKAYLPSMLEGDALEAAVRKVFTETGATTKKDMGKVMQAMQIAYKGAYDGRALSQIVQTLLP